MNTSCNINPVNGANKGGRHAHVFRDHDLKFKRTSTDPEAITGSKSGAVILQPYKPLEPVLKVGTSKITKNLAVYRKRYDEAVKKGDEKTAARNLSKIQSLEFELGQTQRARKGFEAHVVEASWGITKFPPADALRYDPAILQRMWEKCGKVIIQEIFPEIPIERIGVAGHIDQTSIHFHTYFDVPEDTTFTELFKGGKYSLVQQRWNELIRQEFSDLPVEHIVPFESYENPDDIPEYVELSEFKRKTQQNEPKKEAVESTEIALEAQNALLEAQSTILEQSSVIEQLQSELSNLRGIYNELKDEAKAKIDVLKEQIKAVAVRIGAMPASFPAEGAMKAIENRFNSVNTERDALKEVVKKGTDTVAKPEPIKTDPTTKPHLDKTESGQDIRTTLQKLNERIEGQSPKPKHTGPHPK